MAHCQFFYDRIFNSLHCFLQMLPSYKLSQLLPFDMNTREHNQNLEDQLRIYETIHTVALKACHHWHHQNYSNFDALVSENACQIRTFWIISNGIKKSIQTELLKDKLSATSILIERELKPENLKISKKNNLSLGQLFNNIEVELRKKEIFLILTYLLCIMIAKKPNESDEIPLFMTDKADFSCFPLIKKKQAESLNYKAKVLLSKLSVKYIMNLGFS